VTVRDVATASARIRHVFDQRQVEIRRIEVIQPSMEDVFVGLVESEDRRLV
jgi:hypothetical protein